MLTSAWSGRAIDEEAESRYAGMIGGKIVHDSLVECGVEHVFGYSGGANLPVLDQFHASPLKFVMNRSEQCCGHAAEGYARSSGRTGVVLTTSGPGLTNIITPLQDARGDSTPIVALSGQVPTSAVGTDAFQECMAVELTRPCTKWSYQVESVEELNSVVHEAFHVAASGKPGPVHLDLPKDVMTSVLQGPSVPVPLLPPEVQVDSREVRRLAQLLQVAKKPILYVGQGAVEGGAELLAVAEAARVPVTTTLHAMGVFDEYHPLSMHMLGMHGAAYANFAIQESDLIIAVGSRFDDRTTGVLNKYAPEARKAHEEGRGGLVHFDIEPSQFGRVIEPTIAIGGDATQGLRTLLPMLRDQPVPEGREEWLSRCSQLKEAHPFEFEALADGRIKTQQVIAALNDGLAPVRDRLVVSTGVGNHQMMACQARPPPREVRPRRDVYSSRRSVAVPPMDDAALNHHLRLARHDGLRPARCHRRTGTSTLPRASLPRDGARGAPALASEACSRALGRWPTPTRRFS